MISEIKRAFSLFLSPLGLAMFYEQINRENFAINSVYKSYERSQDSYIGLADFFVRFFFRKNS